MSAILVVQNDELVPPGRLGHALDDSTAPYIVAEAFAGAAVPRFTAFRGVVILGGRMGVYDAHRFSYLYDEMVFAAEAVGADVPVLGICLGGQLLAAALGGDARRAPRAEARFETFSSAEAAADPLLRHLDGPQLAVHQDTWTEPPGAVRLLESARYPLAFRLGSALSLQTHPEITPEVFNDWFRIDGFEELVAEAGSDPDELVAAVTRGAETSAAMARRFFGGWIASLPVR